MSNFNKEEVEKFIDILNDNKDYLESIKRIHSANNGIRSLKNLGFHTDEETLFLNHLFMQNICIIDLLRKIEENQSLFIRKYEKEQKIIMQKMIYNQNEIQLKVYNDLERIINKQNNISKFEIISELKKLNQQISYLNNK